MRNRNFVGGLLALALTTFTPVGLAAQGQMTTVISVNERAITQYELTQRQLLLDAFNTSGNLADVAREGLIEDRLKQQEMARFGLQLSPEALAAELEAFAGRANLSLEEFEALLGSQGIAPQTLRDFVATGALWRDFVRGRFSREVSVSEADIDRAITASANRPTQIELLLSEIIIVVTPQNEARAREIAE